jgi:Domain of unknown function (DUF4157)
MYPIKITVKENSWIAKMAAKKLKVSNVAFTLGNTIHLYNASATEFFNDAKWLRHELKHVEQFRRYGFFTFIWKYCMESMKNGYFQNRFEIEAREAERFDF